MFFYTPVEKREDVMAGTRPAMTGWVWQAFASHDEGRTTPILPAMTSVSGPFIKPNRPAD
jgi:hypothetical protein